MQSAEHISVAIMSINVDLRQSAIPSNIAKSLADSREVLQEHSIRTSPQVCPEFLSLAFVVRARSSVKVGNTAKNGKDHNRVTMELPAMPHTPRAARGAGNKFHTPSPPKEVSSTTEISASAPMKTRSKHAKDGDSVDDGVPHVFPLRRDYTGPAVQLRMSNKPASKLTAHARQQLVLDYATLSREKSDEKMVEQQSIIKRLKRTGSEKRKGHVKKTPKGRPKGVMMQIATHYEVSKQTVWDIVADSNARGSTDPLPRKGRKSQITPIKMEAFRDVFNESGGLDDRTLEPLLGDELKKRGRKWTTKYRDYEQRDTPSARTVAVMRKRTKISTLREREVLTDGHKKARVEHLRARVGKASDSIDVDEAYMLPPTRKYRYCTLRPAENVGETTAEALGEKLKEKVMQSFGLHPPKVFLFAAVTRPELLNPDRAEGVKPVFHPRRNGKVLLAVVVGAHDRKIRKRDSEGVLRGQDHWGPVYEHVNISGEVYKHIFESKGGLLDSIEDYYVDSNEARKSSKMIVFWTDKKQLQPAAKTKQNVPFDYDKLVSGKAVIVQEDNAGGHGFVCKDPNNKRTTAWHDALVDACSARGVALIPQPPRSPETNMDDLATWTILRSGLEKNRQKLLCFDADRNANDHAVEKKLWEIIEQV